MFRRLIGFVIFLVGLIGLGAAFLVGTRLPLLIEQTAVSTDDTLQTVSRNLSTIEVTLGVAKTTLADVNETLTTVEESMLVLGTAVTETTPLLDQATEIASSEVPESIEAVQDAIPDLVQVAAVIDDTLVTLNRFQIDETVLGFRINYSLGVDYNPTQPFDETVLSLGEGLEGLPSSLRSLEQYADTTEQNLTVVSQSLIAIGADLAVLNGRIEQIDPLLDEYLKIVTETNDSTRRTRRQIASQWAQLAFGVRLFAAWLALSQLVPLYLGWELMSGYRTIVRK